MRTFALGSILVLVLGGAAAAQSPTELTVDVANSRIYVVTHRTGLLSFLGHEHAILATDWKATACWDAPDHARSHAAFTIRSASLTIDEDSARVLAGIGRGPSDKQRVQIHKKMSANLAVDEFRELSFTSDSVRRTDSGLTLFGKLTVKGRTNGIEMPFTVREEENRIHLNGRSSVRQSTFGVRPESIAGVVKVADRVDLHVTLVATMTPRECR